jgi:hypothetical protein
MHADFTTDNRVHINLLDTIHMSGLHLWLADFERQTGRVV